MEIENPNLRIPPYPKSGWIRIAFTYSFSIFLEDMNYSDSLRKMLLYGGDTDTNACILGALIGSTVGES
jgi:ADP-ribosylglycohydrolase